MGESMIDNSIRQIGSNAEIGLAPFDLFAGAVRALAAGASSPVLGLIESRLSDFGILGVEKILGLDNAEKLLEQKSWRLCFLHVSTEESETAERILSRFGHAVRVVIISDTQSGSQGFRYGRLGARWMFRGEEIGSPGFLEFLRNEIMLAALLPLHSKGALSRYIQVLIQTRPESVEAWARHVGVSTAQLRKVLSGRMPLSPKNLLLAFRVLCLSPGFQATVDSATRRRLEQACAAHPAVEQFLRQDLSGSALLKTRPQQGVAIFRPAFVG